MIAKFFFQTKKRNQLLKNMMNGILCFIFNVAHEGSASGAGPESPGRRGPPAERRPRGLGGVRLVDQDSLSAIANISFPAPMPTPPISQSLVVFSVLATDEDVIYL